MTQAALIDRKAAELGINKKRLRLHSEGGVWILQKREHGGVWTRIATATRLQDFIGRES